MRPSLRASPIPPSQPVVALKFIIGLDSSIYSWATPGVQKRFAFSPTLLIFYDLFRTYHYFIYALNHIDYLELLDCPLALLPLLIEFDFVSYQTSSRYLILFSRSRESRRGYHMNIAANVQRLRP